MPTATLETPDLLPPGEDAGGAVVRLTRADESWLDDVLWAFREEEHEPKDQEERDRYVCGDDRTADYLVSKAKRLKTEYARIDTLIKEKIARLRADRDRLLKPLTAELDWTEYRLSTWIRTLATEDPKLTSRRYEDGTIGLKTKPISWVWPGGVELGDNPSDEEIMAFAEDQEAESALLHWAMSRMYTDPKTGEKVPLVRIELNRDAIRKYVEVKEDKKAGTAVAIDPESGEPVPGLKLNRDPEKEFYLRVS